jgi:hypothetical protein
MASDETPETQKNSDPPIGPLKSDKSSGTEEQSIAAQKNVNDNADSSATNNATNNSSNESSNHSSSNAGGSTSNSTSGSTSPSSNTTSNSFVRQFTDQLHGWLKSSSPEVHSQVESAIESAAQIADQGLASAKAAVDMITEFAGDLTGVESFRVIPKSTLALEVDIRCKQEQDISVKQQVAPFVELQALHLGRRINFEALINQTEKGLQLDINDGMSLKIMAPLIGLQTIEVKGSGLLTRDDKGQLSLVVTTHVPGLSNPITVALPMNHILRDVQSHVQTHIKRKFTNS